MISGLPQHERNRGLSIVSIWTASFVSGNLSHLCRRTWTLTAGTCVFMREPECLVSFSMSPCVCTVVCVVCVIHCEVLCTLPPYTGGVFVQTAPMFAQGWHDDWAGWPGHCLSETQDRPKCSSSSVWRPVHHRQHQTSGKHTIHRLSYLMCSLEKTICRCAILCRAICLARPREQVFADVGFPLDMHLLCVWERTKATRQHGAFMPNMICISPFKMWIHLSRVPFIMSKTP